MHLSTGAAVEKEEQCSSPPDSAPWRGGLSRVDLGAYLPLVIAAVSVSRGVFNSAIEASER